MGATKTQLSLDSFLNPREEVILIGNNAVTDTTHKNCFFVENNCNETSSCKLF